MRIGQSVNFAVERFAAVGEAIADDNPEIRAEMYDACKDGRAAGSLIEQLCSLTAPSLQRSSSAVGVGGTSSGGDGNLTNHLGSASPGGGGGGGGGQSSAGYDSGGSGGREATGGGGGSDPNGSTSASSIRSYADRTAMSRAARALLSSVTRVLLVADTVVVKQIVTSKDRVSVPFWFFMILFYVFLLFFVDMTKTNRRFIVCTTEQKKLTVLVTIFFPLLFWQLLIFVLFAV